MPFSGFIKNKPDNKSSALDGTATSADILLNKTAYATHPKLKLTGTLPSKVNSGTIITPVSTQQAIPQGYYGGALADGLVDVLPSNIKSIQRGTATYNAATTLDVPITVVDLSKAIVIVTACHAYSSGVSPSALAIMGKLTSATNINLSSAASLGSITVSWEVIEFNNVKSVQSGDFSVTSDNTDQSVAITAIDPTKSFIISSSKSGISNATATGMLSIARIASSTSIVIRSSYNTSETVHWQVIEFN